MPSRGKSHSQKDLIISPAPGGEIVIYNAPDGTVSIDVRLERESIWLNQKQMSFLFDTERSVITKHLRNIFNTAELKKNSVCAKFAHTAEDGKTYKTEFYSLDAVLSVGYRVNSKRGTQFRIWATKVLRDHLVRGYSVNEKRLQELKKTVRLISDMADRCDLSIDEATALLRVVGEYGRALDLLDDYDSGRVPPSPGPSGPVESIEYEEAVRIVETLRIRFGDSPIFGRQKDKGLESALGTLIPRARRGLVEVRNRISGGAICTPTTAASYMPGTLGENASL